MRLHRPALVPLLLFTVASTGCTAPTTNNTGNTPSNNPTKPCPRTPSFTQTAATGILPTPTNQTGVAKPYEEINAGLQQFRPKYDDPKYLDIKEDANSYLRAELEGKQIAGWEGWVVSTGVEAIRSAEMKWRIGYEVDDDPVDTEPFSNTVLISMEDPFANAPTPAWTPDRDVLELEKPLIALFDAAQASDQPICIGQKVRFNGYVYETPEIIYQRGDFLVIATSMTVAENALPERDLPKDLADLVIELRRIPGWFGPDYQLMVFGDGTVVFEGRRETTVQGFKITSVSEGTLRQLLSEFESVGFSSMTDFDKGKMSDAASARTTLDWQGKRNSVYHYFGNSMPDEKITQLENKIDELIQTEKWVGKDQLK